jgi:hypothetical protein
VSRRQQSVDVSDEVEVQRRDPHARNADPSEMSLDREEQVACNPTAAMGRHDEE